MKNMTTAVAIAVAGAKSHLKEGRPTREPLEVFTCTAEGGCATRVFSDVGCSSAGDDERLGAVVVDVPGDTAAAICAATFFCHEGDELLSCWSRTASSGLSSSEKSSV